ncbi:MAG: LPXTG cell wall anchor domain-containing protein [Erysipelotrichaceae bacterium]|nr:LPXTG cell wall anchor domain-containing protein [Erysipelotrichaceae bacterium]MBQ1910352.1 LPXTG cell wall anchor domain-containing protein [Erysipelotrichaceae bacterium]MBQ2139005.1 LPXTG cell wall anchor domain-containing protein [Erysipelotrichaceae bacterium]MBQ2233296.1 LPXTG cell wall anchor domain-containing protein [Erysipelotrichaceae bacterium]MBQ4019128.1 LPXTG cell wall anchor domain-containing protein [Erysipelotrichaceae bacterium]
MAGKYLTKTVFALWLAAFALLAIGAMLFLKKKRKKA